MLCWGLLGALIFLFLDWINLPSKILGASPIFEFFRKHVGKWGNLTVGLVLGIALPDIIKSKIFKNTEELKKYSEDLKKQSESLTKSSEEILDYVRGSLTTFNKAYAKVVEILEGIENDKESCFIMASQMPALGADKNKFEDNIFLKGLHKRLLFCSKTRIISCSPYDKEGFEFDNKESTVAKFCKHLSEYRPGKNSDECSKFSKIEIFDEIKKTFEIFENNNYRKNVDVIVVESIPYQIFLGKDSNDKKRCVFLLSGLDAIENNLPSGGFYSEEDKFIDLIEKSIQALLGSDKDVYKLQQMHSKEIESKWKEYAERIKLASPSDIFKSEKIRQFEKVEFKNELIDNFELTVCPYVFNPRDAESGEVMLEAVTQCINKKHKLVIDVGCGSGLLTVAAVKAGAGEVIALDCNPYAVSCTKLNCKDNNIDESRVKVIKSDLFEHLKIEGKADIIIADLPFVDKHVKKDDWIGLSLYDFMLNLNERFLSEAENYIKDDGHVIISFSTLSSTEKFEKKISDKGWDPAKSDIIKKNDYEWYYYILRRTKGHS